MAATPIAAAGRQGHPEADARDHTDACRWWPGSTGPPLRACRRCAPGQLVAAVRQHRQGAVAGAPQKPPVPLLQGRPDHPSASCRSSPRPERGVRPRPARLQDQELSVPDEGPRQAMAGAVCIKLALGVVMRRIARCFCSCTTQRPIISDATPAPGRVETGGVRP